MTGTADFRYELPTAAIAQVPIEPRHAARLLDVRTGSDHRFFDLPGLLEPGDLVVVNRTRVRAGRLHGRKRGSGGQVEALLLRAVDESVWEALVRPARRLRPGVGLDFSGEPAEIVAGPESGVARLRFRPGLEDRLERIGEVPLPPYFTGALEDADRYQTLFAKAIGSAAAPTAGLHFTPEVVEGMAERGVDIAEVDLEVGLDTFRPISSDDIEDHRMHRERYTVPEAAADAIAATRRRGSRVVAIGTTVVRTLESAVGTDGAVTAGSGETDLFITPGFRFRVTDLLVTNFHVPGSTLVVMIAAYMGEGWRDAYTTALKRGYRFLSFGDAMLAERAQ